MMKRSTVASGEIAHALHSADVPVGRVRGSGTAARLTMRVKRRVSAPAGVQSLSAALRRSSTCCKVQASSRASNTVIEHEQGNPERSIPLMRAIYSDARRRLKSEHDVASPVKSSGTKASTLKTTISAVCASAAKIVRSQKSVDVWRSMHAEARREATTQQEIQQEIAVVKNELMEGRLWMDAQSEIIALVRRMFPGQSKELDSLLESLAEAFSNFQRMNDKLEDLKRTSGLDSEMLSLLIGRMDDASRIAIRRVSSSGPSNHQDVMPQRADGVSPRADCVESVSQSVTCLAPDGALAENYVQRQRTAATTTTAAKATARATATTKKTARTATTATSTTTSADCVEELCNDDLQQLDIPGLPEFVECVAQMCKVGSMFRACVHASLTVRESLCETPLDAQIIEELEDVVCNLALRSSGASSTTHSMIGRIVCKKASDSEGGNGFLDGSCSDSLGDPLAAGSTLEPVGQSVASESDDGSDYSFHLDRKSVRMNVAPSTLDAESLRHKRDSLESREEELAQCLQRRIQAKTKAKGSLAIFRTSAFLLAHKHDKCEDSEPSMDSLPTQEVHDIPHKAAFPNKSAAIDLPCEESSRPLEVRDWHERSREESQALRHKLALLASAEGIGSKIEDILADRHRREFILASITGSGPRDASGTPTMALAPAPLPPRFVDGFWRMLNVVPEPPATPTSQPSRPFNTRPHTVPEAMTLLTAGTSAVGRTTSSACTRRRRQPTVNGIRRARPTRSTGTCDALWRLGLVTVDDDPAFVSPQLRGMGSQQRSGRRPPMIS